MTATVTTSWDDGGVDDARLADLLASHGVPGTFYWTVDSERFPLPSASDRNAVADAGMEIGSHTMTHPDMRTIRGDELRWEVTESKARLEDLMGAPITTFCYPFGYFDRIACRAVADAGYALGRTTLGFRSDLGPDRFRVPTTLQVFPHPRRVHVTHSLREGNVRGLASWVGHHRASSDLLELTEAALARAIATDGVLHLWGHSWELTQFDLWDTLDAMLAVVGRRSDVRYVTNGQLIDP